MAQAAQPAPPPFREGHTEAEGFRIRCLEAGGGDAVVMLDSMKWGLSQLHHALAQRYRVVALEPPGLGSSPVNTTSRSVKDLAHTMAQAASNLAQGKYTLIGTSFSANIALWLALQTPEHVEALILISPTAILPVEQPSDDKHERLFAHTENAHALPSVDPADLAREQDLVRRLKGSTHDAEVESRLSELQCPTLVIFGVKDRMVAPEAARIYGGKIPNGNVSLVYDSGHLIAFERPDALCNLVADYVERRETFIVGRGSGVINP